MTFDIQISSNSTLTQTAKKKSYRLILMTIVKSLASNDAQAHKWCAERLFLFFIFTLFDFIKL